MKLSVISIFILLLCLSISPISTSAQEENAAAIQQGTRYVDLKTKSLEKYNSRIEHQQDQLLKKLKRKENHFAHKLKKTDSLGYAHYKQQRSPSYDSIGKLSRNDTNSIANDLSVRKNPAIDTLKGVQSFVQSKSGQTVNVPTQESSANLNQLQGNLNYRNYINQLITNRTEDLKNLSGSGSNIPGISGIEKQVFYGKSKMSVFKDMEEDPTKAEDQAMEYLQGTKGFDQSMSNATGAGGMQQLGAAGASPSQLEQMGYQTKQLLQTNLTKKFGGNVGGMAQQMSGQVSQMQDKEKNLVDTKGSIQDLGHASKPDFKINPMRGLPFWKRVQKQYGFQTAAANSTTNQPALIEPSASLGFKQNPKLTYGVGVACSFGLGQNWQNLHLSFQGVGFKSFVTWELFYGIGVYVGYERMYSQFVFINNNQTQSSEVPVNAHNTANYNESALVGLTKSYHMNAKYSGQVQVLYDIWWRETGLPTPFVLRFTTIKI